AMVPKREKFAGPVEVDETYVGGSDYNRHFDQRLGKYAGKVAVIGILDRPTKQVRAHVIENADRRTMHNYVVKRTERSAVVYSDEHQGYAKLPREHHTVTHSWGVYARGRVSTNGIEAFWSILKRSYKGTYHTLSRKHLNRYLAEFSSRHNDRALDAVDRIGKIIKAMEGKRLRYQDLVGAK
ncbi:MAG: IS1595 family transposase, partial [Chloroflexi bacterium]|nr:IS1595 family transposase [Chloroflexota bacterium]